MHALRHTYASLSIAAGVSLFELSRPMGRYRRCSTTPTDTCSDAWVGGGEHPSVDELHHVAVGLGV